MIFNLNCDIGESRSGYDLQQDLEILRYVNACNVACGGHAGDPETAAEIIKFCGENKVLIGAHPSFPDKENFGRKRMDLSYDALFTTLRSQIAALHDLALSLDSSLYHVKPHGALYNIACKEEKEANAVINATQSVNKSLKIMAPARSLLAEMAQESGLFVIPEAFADRNYNSDLSLVSRTSPNAVIEDKELVLQHLLEMKNEGMVNCIDGISRAISAETFCIHGDNPAALEILEYLKNKQ